MNQIFFQRRLTRVLPAVAALLLANACESDLPAPSITSVFPTETSASAPVQLVFQVDAVLPYDINYNDRTGSVAPAVQVHMGSLRLYQGNWPAKGDFSVYLPSVLQPGSYDLSVRLSDGRSAVATGAVLLTPGQWPSSYAFDPIDDQLAGIPFPISIRALGGNAAAFTGNVTLSSSVGDLQPVTSAAFVNGVLQQSVTLRFGFGPVQITARDSEGHVGISNTFQVR